MSMSAMLPRIPVLSRRESMKIEMMKCWIVEPSHNETAKGLIFRTNLDIES